MSHRVIRVPDLLRSLAVVGAVAMTLSLFFGFFDRFLLTMQYGEIGIDFFSVPRAWINLLHGENIFATEICDYGPYATWYPYHPALSVAVGSWTSLLSPTASYLSFVCVSLGVLWLSATIVARRTSDENAKALAYFALFAAPPTYLLLWNGQMHVFTVLAAACLLAGLVDATSMDATRSSRGAVLAAAGLLISLLSKPLFVIALPLLLLLKETRRAAVTALLLYVAVSLAFLFIPALNPRGAVFQSHPHRDNWVHWTNIWEKSGSSSYMAAPDVLRTASKKQFAEWFSLSSVFNHFFPGRVPTFVYHLPLAAVLAFSVLAAKTREVRRRTTLALVAAMLGVQAYFLGYTIVWEYHYTTLLPTVPVLWWLYRAEKTPSGRRAAACAFWATACLLLPTLYFLFPSNPESHQTLGKLFRVGPLVLAFLSLLVYGTLVAAGRASGLSESAPDGDSHKWADRRLAMAAAAAVGVAVFVGVAWPDNRISVFMTGDEASQCRKVTEILPNRLQAWMFRGEVLYQAGRYDDAVDAMEAALRRNPAFVPVHQMLARSLRAQGKLSEAAAHLQTAIRLDPANAEYHADLGAVFMDMKNYDAARRELNEALQRNPALGEAIRNLNILPGRSGVR
jgi:hypothetical protein